MEAAPGVSESPKEPCSQGSSLKDGFCPVLCLTLEIGVQVGVRVPSTLQSGSSRVFDIGRPYTHSSTSTSY